MKKRKFVLMIVSALVIAVLAASLVGCLKIRMRERNIEKRLKDAGAEVTQARTSPMTPSDSGYRIGTIMLAYKVVSDKDAESGDEIEHSDVLYVFFAKDDDSADWIEKQCDDFIKAGANQPAEGEEIDPDESSGVQDSWNISKWNVYRYDKIVMCGHYKILKDARGY